MPWGVAAAAVGAVGSVAGSAMSKGSGSQSSTQSLPWNLPQLQGVEANAQGIYNSRIAAGPYTGSYYSPINGTQQGAANQAASYASGPGAAISNGLYGSSQTLGSAATPYVSNANYFAQNGLGGPTQAMQQGSAVLQNYANGTQTTQGAQPALSQSLNSAAVQGAQSLGQFSGSLQQVANKGLSDPTQQIANDASSYATSPYVQAQEAAANQQIDQTLQEQTLPGLNRQASAGGSLNSSRAGMAEAMANRDAATLKTNAAAQIGGQAYSQGLNTAGSLYSSGLNTAAGAASSGYNGAAGFSNAQAGQQIGVNQFNTNTQVNSANLGLTQGLAYQQANTNAQLSANSQLGTASNLGLAAADQAGRTAAQNYSLGSAAGSLYQNDQNAQLANAYQQWQMGNGYQQNVLNDYSKTIMGAAGYGNTQTGTTQTTNPQNYAGSVLGGASLGYGLYNNWNQASGGGYYAPGGYVSGGTWS